MYQGKFSPKNFTYVLNDWIFSLLDPRQWPKGSYEIGFVLPSVLPPFRPFVLLLFVLLSKRFLGIVSLVFSKFGHGTRNSYSMKLCVAEPDLPEKFFLPPKLGKWTENRPKQCFLSLLKNIVINFCWICSVIKIYIICCVPAQIPYLGKFWFQRYEPKCSQPVRLQDF